MTRKPLGEVLGVALLLLSSLTSAISQAPENAHISTTTTTLHVKAREVVLDIVVTDKNGNFVKGLTKDDFALFEDKTRQNIVYFQPPSMHGIPPDAPEVRSTVDLQKIGNAPVTILVLDELNTAFADMAYARGALEKWLEHQPSKLPQPAVLMVASDEKFALLHDYTQDRDTLLVALKQHFPSYPFRMSKGGSIGPDAGERMAKSLGTLMEIAQASGGTVGRKNVIWVGVGFPQLLLDDVSGNKEDEITQAVVRATNVMLKSRVTLNIIDPTAMADSSLDMNNPDYLTLGSLQSAVGPTSSKVSGYLNFDTFAPATGGAFYYGRNDVDREIAQAVSNGSNYYTLAYSPTNHEENPARFRNIQIVMRDPNLTATTRTGYFPEAPVRAGAPTPPNVHDLAFDLMNAALNAIVYNGLKVSLKKAGEGYLLQVGAAELQPHQGGNGNDIAEITVMQVCFDAKNRVLTHQAFELKSSIVGGDPQPSQIDFTVPSISIPQATRRIRFVVRDALNGHIGTVDSPYR